MARVNWRGRAVVRIGRWLCADQGAETVASVRAENDALRREIEKWREAHDALRTHIERQRTDAQKQHTEIPAEPPPVVPTLITFADRLVDLTTRGTPADPAAMLRWLATLSDRLLAECEVERVDDTGAVDLSRHEVVAQLPAPDDDLIECIAETVRPGYRWHGRLIRFQQVIVYSPTEVTR